MNLFKKVVAGASIFAVAVVSVAPGASAFTNAQLDAANTLAASGIIVDHSNDPIAYNMDQTVLRQEIAAVARGIYEVDNGVAVNSAKTSTCANAFADVSATNPNVWACYTVEGLLNADVIAGNPTFRPEENITKSEALGMVVRATCNDYAFDASSSLTWQEQLGAFASARGIASFTDYNTAATRGFTFEAGVNSMNACSDTDTTSDTDDLLSDLLNDLDNDTTTDTNTGTDTTTDTSTTTNNGDLDIDTSIPTDNGVTGGILEVSLSPATPESATIPASVNGIPVAAFDFSAGDSDVTISQIVIKRRGLSDEDTLTSLAAFTSLGRASNEKDDNNENDTEAQLNLSGGWVVILAGQTRTITIVADLGVAAEAANDEFALELVEVQASADVQVNGALRANTMRIGSVDAPLLIFTPGSSVSDPKLGERGADIFEFEIEGANDEDVILRSITFEGSSDAEDDLINFELYYDNDLVAFTEVMNDDYVTFDLGDGILIEEDKTEDFTVTADVIEGATDIIEFRIDEALDITAESTKFGFGAAVNIDDVENFGDLGSVEIEAGELTITEVEPEFDEIREDKDNLVLGGFKVTNVAGENLELEEFGVLIDLRNDGDLATVDGVIATAETIFEEIELYSLDTGSSYELDDINNIGLSAVFSEDSVDVILNEGVTEWQIRADTVDDIENFDAISFEISFVTGDDQASTQGSFLVVEQDDDEEVEDITPSSVTFNTIDGAQSGAQVSLIPLADIDVVRGADDVVALQFEIEAEESSDIFIDEFTVNVRSNSGAAAATNQEIAEVKLYQGSISEANLLDSESGSQIGTTGDVSFDDVDDIFIAANDTEEFIVTISIVDGNDASDNSDYVATLTALDIDDDENDEIEANGLPLTSARDITVNDTGTIITLAFDPANRDNEFDKQGLAGEDIIIASYDVRADNEEVDVEEVVFTLEATGSGILELQNTVINATLLLNGVEIETNTSGDIDAAAGTISFDDMDHLIIPTRTTELALTLNTANIGEDFVGQAIAGLIVTDVVFAEAEGADSGEDLTAADIVTFDGRVSRTLDIVTAVVTPAVQARFGTDDQTAELQLVVDGGDNTTPAGDNVQAELTSLAIEVTSVTEPGAITVFNGNGLAIGNSAEITAAGTVVILITTADSVGNDNETYRIESTIEASHRLATDGVGYSVNGVGAFTTQLENTLELGQYAESN